eukprot:3101036-Amphidinium_carterae.1
MPSHASYRYLWLPLSAVLVHHLSAGPLGQTNFPKGVSKSLLSSHTPGNLKGGQSVQLVQSSGQSLLGLLFQCATSSSKQLDMPLMILRDAGKRPTVQEDLMNAQ